MTGDFFGCTMDISKSLHFFLSKILSERCSQSLCSLLSLIWKVTGIPGFFFVAWWIPLRDFCGASISCCMKFEKWPGLGTTFLMHDGYVWEIFVESVLLVVLKATRTGDCFLVHDGFVCEIFIQPVFHVQNLKSDLNWGFYFSMWWICLRDIHIEPPFLVAVGFWKATVTGNFFRCLINLSGRSS